MTTHHALQNYQYVRRSTRRQCLIELLSQPMTPTQLARHASMTIKTACKIVAELRHQGLIQCLTPGMQRSRLYQRTKSGQAVWSEIARTIHPTQPTPTLLLLPQADHNAYAQVCHRHRSAVVRALGMPRRASQIKKWQRINLPEVTISANNVRDVLSTLSQLGVVRRINNACDNFPIFALTPRGQRFHNLLNHPPPESSPPEPSEVAQELPLVISLESSSATALAIAEHTPALLAQSSLSMGVRIDG